MRHHLYEIRWSLLILLAILCGLGVAWGGESSAIIPLEYRLESKPIPKYHQIDWNKVQTFEDICLILSLFPLEVSEDHEEFEKFRRFLKEEQNNGR